jgi:hypothetical protein
MAINFPDSPSVDDTFAAEGKSWVWNGTVWQAKDSADIITLDTPPSNPPVGQFWWNSVTSRLYVYYDSFWVEAVSNNTGATGATGPTGPTGTTGATGVTGEASFNSFLFIGA